MKEQTRGAESKGKGQEAALRASIQEQVARKNDITNVPGENVIDAALQLDEQPGS